VALVHEVAPDQCTLVPVRPGEITSQAGWALDTPRQDLAAVVREMQAAGIRVSLFVDPTPDAVALAADLGADRVELYTEPFARAHERGEAAGLASFTAVRRGGRGRARARARRECRPRSRPEATCRSSAPCRTSTRCRSGMRS
jgi:pyridoxine 5'-phosphate synthase PdxJ